MFSLKEPPPTPIILLLHVEGYRSGRNGVDSKSTWRCEPPRGFESHPLRHPTLLEVRSGRSGTSRLRRVSSEAPKRRVFGCREERRWAGLTAEDEGIRTGAAADESNR